MDLLKRVGSLKFKVHQVEDLSLKPASLASLINQIDYISAGNLDEIGVP